VNWLAGVAPVSPSGVSTIIGTAPVSGSFAISSPS
jgi:hypothetical protein